jgi:hypothetical protein
VAIPITVQRRTFLALVGIGLVTACTTTKSAAPLESDIAQVIADKQMLIADATNIMATSPEFTSELQAVIAQNQSQIAVLGNFVATATPAPSNQPNAAVDLAAVASRCAVFSNNHLVVACRSSDAEISRVLAQIAASEMQHHALLTGLLT